MTKILFICWGNICRSPAAELLFADMARRAGCADAFFVSSAGVSDEEEGNGVYPPMRRLLEERGLDCSGIRARMLRRVDYDSYDLLVCMDSLTIGRTRRFFGGDPDGKVKNLLDYAGQPGAEIDDPWYTRAFDRALSEIEEGCAAMLDALIDAGAEQNAEAETLDFSRCAERAELYDALRAVLPWKDWYGHNLDALWDVLTGPEFTGRRYRLILPPEDSPLAPYAKLVRETFREADRLEE